MTTTAITRAGLERLIEELDDLRTNGRREMAARIQQAAEAEANAAESSDYQDAREDQALLERRIALLEARVADAEVVEPDDENGVLDVGERVRLRDLDTGERLEYDLVGTLEADPTAGRVSAVSPLGRAVLGRRRGEIAVVEAPRGTRRLKILSVRPSM